MVTQGQGRQAPPLLLVLERASEPRPTFHQPARQKQLSCITQMRARRLGSCQGLVLTWGFCGQSLGQSFCC